MLPSVYVVGGRTLTAEQRLTAAILYCGEPSQVTGPTALRLHGFRYGPDDDRVHVLVPHARHLTSVGFLVVHRTRRLDPASVERDGHPAVSVARAVVDVARQCDSARAVRAIVTEAVQRRLTTVKALRDELERARRNGTLFLRQALDDVDLGVRSAPEAALVRRSIVETVLQRRREGVRAALRPHDQGVPEPL